MTESASERCITLRRRGVESIVRRELARDFPDAFGGIEFRRVARQSVQRNFVAVRPEPFFAGLVEPVTGTIVDDEKYFLWRVLRDELLQEFEESRAVEDVSEAVGKIGIVERNCTENVSGLSHAVRIDAWLLAYSGPGLVKSSIEPEAGFILEDDEPSAGGRFFLMAGSLYRSQMA